MSKIFFWRTAFICACLVGLLAQSNLLTASESQNTECSHTDIEAPTTITFELKTKLQSLLFDIDNDGILDFFEWVAPVDPLLAKTNKHNGSTFYTSV